MPSSKKRVLIILGRIGRFWGNHGEVLLGRAQLARETLDAQYHYDRVVITGGPEFSLRSNALILYSELVEALATGPVNSEQVVLDEERRRNQVALIHAVDDARVLWPRDNLSFHIVTSGYAVARMDAYLERHIQHLIRLHGEHPSPRQLFWRFAEAAEEPHPTPRLSILRERARRWLDLHRPYPVPLVKVN